MNDVIDGSRRRALAMLSLVLAGEAIFIPAFHLGRYFKTALLSTFQIDEFQLGQLGAIYGVVHCYIGEEFKARNLCSIEFKSIEKANVKRIIDIIKRT